MHKIFSLTLIVGLLIAACGVQNTPTSTSVPLPSPTIVPTMSPPALIREIKLETQTGTAYTLNWSGDGKTLAVASGGEIILINDDLREIQKVFKPEKSVLGITWNPDRTQFATVNGFRDPTVTLWDWDGEDQLVLAREIEADADQYGVSWSLNGKLLATLAGDNKSVVQIWDASTWEEIQTFDLPYTKPRRALQWSVDNSTVYGAGELNGQAVFFGLDVTDGTVNELGKFFPSQAEVFAISPAGDRFAVADLRGVVQIIDVVSGDVLTGIKSVNQPVDMAWNPSGRTLAILDYKTALQLWDVSK
jgi:WD40 repeat protein